jgi:hypothetical protein
MVECVLQSCEGADVWQDVAVEDSGDGGMRDTGHVGQSAKRELAGAHSAVQVAGEEQPAVGAQLSVVGQDDLRPVSVRYVVQRVPSRWQRPAPRREVRRWAP